MRTLTLAATVLLTFSFTQNATAQQKPDVLPLGSIDLGELRDAGIFQGRNVTMMRLEFEGGVIRGLWTRGAAIISLEPIEGESRVFRGADILWTPRGGSLVGWSWGETSENPAAFGLGRWNANTQRPSPAILIGLLFDADVTSLSAAPLTLAFDRTGRLTITLDAFSADRLRVFGR